MIRLEPNINWIPFDKDNPPTDLVNDTNYLIFLREDDYDDGATWAYHVDIATAYGRYLDDFWDSENDWKEGQRVEVLAYAEFPYMQKEEECKKILEIRFEEQNKIIYNQALEDFKESIEKSNYCNSCSYKKDNCQKNCPMTVQVENIMLDYLDSLMDIHTLKQRVRWQK